MNRSSVINRIQRIWQLPVYRSSDSGEYGFGIWLMQISLNYHTVECNHLASSPPIPSNPQVRILPFPHHSMRLLSNHTSEAKASTSNPHLLFPLSLTNRLDDHEPLNTQSTNCQLPHRFKQTGIQSIHFQRDHRLREECEEWNPVTCESRSLETPPEASSMVLACFVGYMGRPTEWLVSCAHSLPTLDFSLTTRMAKKKVTDRQLAPLAHGLSERSLGNNRGWCYGHWLAN